MGASSVSSFRLFIVFIVVLFFTLIGFLCCENREGRALRSRISELEISLARAEQKVRTIVIRDTIKVSQAKVVEVDKTDYKKELADKELIKDLQLKLGQIESENRMLRETRDTVYLSSVNDSTLRYHDKWVDFEYMVGQKMLGYAVRDSLSTYIVREYKHKFLWFKWGTKGYDIYIVNHNPHSSVVYDKYIKIKK